MNANDYWTTSAGIRIPKIIYGTAWKQERTAALVERALAAGFRGIDTACQPKHYHEPGVGDGLSGCFERGLLTRSALYLQTKFTSVDGQDPARIPYDPKADLAGQINQSVHVSLNNLRTDYLDCLVLHSPLPTVQQTLQAWQALETHVANGSIRQLGISNCYDLKLLETLYGAATIKPAVIQNRFYAQTGYDARLREYCLQHNIFYQSFWTLTANPQVLAHSTVKTLAEAYRRTTAQIFFRYLTQLGIVPLSGTTSATHMQEDLAIFDFELTPAECALIGNLLT